MPELMRRSDFGASIHKKIPMRSDRIFNANGAWYFSTREKASIGPYQTKKEAETGIEDFIYFIQNARIHTVRSFLGGV